MEQTFEHHAIINKIVVNKLLESSDIKKNDVVLEIGPGNGVITKELCKVTKKVIVVEKDIDCRKYLDVLLEKYNNLKVIYADILDIDLPFFNKIVANIPFNISEPLMYKLVKIDFDYAVLIVGKDFADNAASFNYESRISVFTNCYFDTKVSRNLDKKYFSPEPRTIPVVIKVYKKDKTSIDDKLLYFLRDLFDQKDKKLKNALVESFINNKFNKDKKITQKIARQIVKEFSLDNKILEKSILLISNQEINKLVERLKEYLCK